MEIVSSSSYLSFAKQKKKNKFSTDLIEAFSYAYELCVFF